MEQIRITPAARLGGKPTVSARAIHAATGTRTNFQAWATYRLKTRGFTEGTDYVVDVDPATGRKDYHMTLRMAKTFIEGYAQGTLPKAVFDWLEGKRFLLEGEAAPATLPVVKAPTFAAPDHLKGVKTMCSVEIVEVINALRKPGAAELLHKNFMVKVEGHPGIAGLNFKHTYFDSQGKVQPCYYLPKREAELMVMSESLEVQTKVYDRLTELEAQVATHRLPQTYAEALLELAANVQKQEALQLANAAQAAQIEQQSALIGYQKPAVDFVEKYVEADGLKTFRAVAKLLGAKEPEFRGFLVDRKIHFRLAGEWTHAAKYGENGAKYFVTKTGISLTTEKQYNRSYFTPKGVEWITRMWNERTPVLTRKSVMAADIQKLAR